MNCVKGEIHNVLSMMRVNTLWASADRFKHEIPASTQSPMIRTFQQLHYELQSVVDLSDVDTVLYLLPFIMVIESEKTSGFITGAAISSLNKFLLYGLITCNSLRADIAINRIAVCASRCRFEETHRADDECVLMKLLELVEYALRCDAGCLITSANVWNMVQLCYRISCQPRSSLHLCRAAENTLAHIILTVFDRIHEIQGEQEMTEGESDKRKRKFSIHSQSSGDSENRPQRALSTESVYISTNLASPYDVILLEQILQFLSRLISPSSRDDATIILGLRLINIVLETAGTGLSHHPRLVTVLQSDLSKYLLQNSETSELAILSLTLRVVFNLFNSIKDHLKIQLEVFFTSMHMRIIDSSSSSNEQKELALESLLEFCREPGLILDLYVNYDCDVQCTNLFEVLCQSLARNCSQLDTSMSNREGNSTQKSSEEPPLEGTTGGQLNALTILCLEGLLAVMEAIARRCPLKRGKSDQVRGMHLNLNQLDADRSSFSLLTESISPMSSVREVMNFVMASEKDSDSQHDYSESETDHSNSSALDKAELEWLHTARERTAEILQERKRVKQRFALAAEKFNTDQKGWMEYVHQMGLLPEKKENEDGTVTFPPESVANFFLKTPGLNKTLIGDFIGDGPEDKYPFKCAVRDAYVKMLDFKKTNSLDEALRLFLAKFRLPGEAQKIDRLMEVFSKEFYAQTCESEVREEGEESHSLFANADTAYVLAFSIIMLNTDLHSDRIAKKMTLEEFIRNNRGINNGKDLPAEYLTTLYENIQNNQIQMQQDASDLMDSSILTSVDKYSEQWDGILKRSEHVVGASFTSNPSIMHLPAGIYERNMFELIWESSLHALLVAFVNTRDPQTMSKVLDGVGNCAKIALYFGNDRVFDRVMQALSSYFLTFAYGVLNGERVELLNVNSDSRYRVSDATDKKSPPPTEDEGELDLDTGDENNGLIIGGIHALSDVEGDIDFGLGPTNGGSARPLNEEYVQNAKLRRSILSLKVLFQFVQYRNHYFRNAWISVMECVLMFNELDIIPISLVEMDDFVDSRGVPLPPIQDPNSSTKGKSWDRSTTSSTTALSSKNRERSRRLAERQALNRARLRERDASGSLWLSLSSLLWSDDDEMLDANFSQLTKLLQKIVGRLGGGILEKKHWVKMVRKLPDQSLEALLKTLITCRDPFQAVNNEVQEREAMQENAIFLLELSVDLILVNSHRLVQLNLWDHFHLYARKVLSTPLGELQMPYLVERVVVHILRVSIRLFHDVEIRPHLMKTLKLLQTMSEELQKLLADRLACGVTMLLKANLMYMMEDFQEWHILLALIDRTVNLTQGRCESGWESLNLLFEAGVVKDEVVTPWIRICLSFLNYYGSRYATESLRLLSNFANNTIGDSTCATRYPVKMTTWLEILKIFTEALFDQRPIIAKTAYESLYKSLLAPGIPVAPKTWILVFNNILFTLDDRATQISTSQIGKKSYDEIQLQAINLLSKTFLQHLTDLLQQDLEQEFRKLWLEIVERLALKLQGGNGSSIVVSETAFQALFNLLVVLRSEDMVLDRVDSSTGSSLFQEMCSIINLCCPQMMSQLDLDTPTPQTTTEIQTVEPVVPPTQDQAENNKIPEHIVVESDNAEQKQPEIEQVDQTIFQPVDSDSIFTEENSTTDTTNIFNNVQTGSQTISEAENFFHSKDESSLPLNIPETKEVDTPDNLETFEPADENYKNKIWIDEVTEAV